MQAVEFLEPVDSQGANLSTIPCCRTTRRAAGRLLRERLPWSGLWYGGGLPERTASQSNGVEEEMEGVDAGERYTARERGFRGVGGMNDHLKRKYTFRCLVTVECANKDKKREIRRKGPIHDVDSPHNDFLSLAVALDQRQADGSALFFPSWRPSSQRA
jgi:hypothetical protein